MLGIIIVDYKGAERTINFIRREIVKIQTPWKLVIVNNCASVESNTKFILELGAHLVTLNCQDINKFNIFLIPSSENLGFARGNNLGANFLINNFQCQYLLFSNNDIEFKDSDVVEHLIKKLSSDNTIGMIGPEVIGLDGKRQSPEPYISIESRFLLPYILSPFLPQQTKINLFKYNYSDYASEGRHFRIMGCFFLMPTAAFQKINGMDPNTFLYSEEMILSKRLEFIGKYVYFYPGATIVHAHGTSTKKVFSDNKMRLIQAKSEKYYYTTYCGVSSIKASILLGFYRLYLAIRSSLKNLNFIAKSAKNRSKPMHN